MSRIMLSQAAAVEASQERNKRFRSRFTKADRTKQSFRDECDINVLLRRFAKTGVIPQRTVVPLEGDFTETMDFRAMQDALNRARDSFLSLPVDVRERFGHSPEKFVRWSLDKDNLAEMRKLGLAKPEEVPVKREPQEVRIVADDRVAVLDKGGPAA